MGKDRGESLLIAKSTVNIPGGYTVKPYIRYIAVTLAVVIVVGVLLYNYILSTKQDANVEDNSCHSHGVKGMCKSIKNCPSAVKMLYKSITLSLCSLKNNEEPIVCCVDLDVLHPTDTVPIMPRIGEDSATNDLDTPVEIAFGEQCKPISAALTATRTGRKAFDKCVEYQEQLIYPCMESLSPNGGMYRADHCNWKPEGLIINGENAYLGEFPHMVLLGYGKTIIEWLCGGILISNRFILTVAHCTVSARRGQVTKVKIGILERSEKAHHSKQYNVVKIHTHPHYNSPLNYNDIALLEVDRRMHLNRLAVPACLHAGGAVDDSEVIMAGWGVTVVGARAGADVLQKVTLTKFSDEECALKLKNIRHLPHGYNSTTQVCYGDRNATRDTCNGDSGGPAQVKHPKLYCMYYVVGIISWSKKCGVANQPGVYTRVAPYLSWIEGIVWPS